MDQDKALEMVAMIVARLEQRAVNDQTAPGPTEKLAYEGAARVARLEAAIAGIDPGTLQAAVTIAHAQLISASEKYATPVKSRGCPEVPGSVWTCSTPGHSRGHHAADCEDCQTTAGCRCNEGNR
jgi:hypothetical protein